MEVGGQMCVCVEDVEGMIDHNVLFTCEFQ